MEKGIKFFKQAIEKYPNYALAYAALAASYSLMQVIGIYDPREDHPFNLRKPLIFIYRLTAFLFIVLAIKSY